MFLRFGGYIDFLSLTCSLHGDNPALPFTQVNERTSGRGTERYVTSRIMKVRLPTPSPDSVAYSHKHKGSGRIRDGSG